MATAPAPERHRWTTNRLAGVLEGEAAQALLRSTIPARLAFTGLDDAPRVVPIWFHWDGEALLMFSNDGAYKARAIARRPAIAVVIDTAAPPYHVLTLRGVARLTPFPPEAPPHAAHVTTVRYLGEAGAEAFEAALPARAIVQIALVPNFASLQIP